MANEDAKKSGANNSAEPSARNPYEQTHYSIRDPNVRQENEKHDPYAEDGRAGNPEAMAAVKAAIAMDPLLRKQTGLCFLRALRADVAFANAGIWFDVLGNKVRIAERGMLPFPSEGKTERSQDVWNDTDTTRAVNYLTGEYGFVAKGRQAKQEFLDEMRVWIQDRGEDRNPLAMILDDVEITDWKADQKLFTEGLHCPDNGYYRETSVMLCAQLVRMALRIPRKGEEEPKAEWVPIIIGPQGIGKSEFCKRLAVRDEWYGKIGGVNVNDRDAVAMKTRGKTVMEAAEMAFFRANSPDNMKDYLSTSSDEYRSPYGMAVEDHPRTHVTVGTTNHTVVLHDPTGYRRFSIVKPGFDRALDKYKQACDNAGNWIGILDPKTGKTIPTPYQMPPLVLQALAVALQKVKAGTDPLPGHYSAEAEAYREKLAAEASDDNPADEKADGMLGMEWPADDAPGWGKAEIKAWIHFRLGISADAETTKIIDDPNHHFHEYAMDLQHLAKCDLPAEELAQIRSRYGKLRMLPLSAVTLADPKAKKEEIRDALEKRGWVPARSDPAHWIGGKPWRNVYEAPDGGRGVFVPLDDDGSEDDEKDAPADPKADSRDSPAGQSQEPKKTEGGEKGSGGDGGYVDEYKDLPF